MLAFAGLGMLRAACCARTTSEDTIATSNRNKRDIRASSQRNSTHSSKRAFDCQAPFRHEREPLLGLRQQEAVHRTEGAGIFTFERVPALEVRRGKARLQFLRRKE